MDIILGLACIVLSLLIVLGVYAIVLRTAVWISNKCLNGSGDERSRDWDDEDDYDFDRPRLRRASAIPEPNIGKGMGIAFVVVILSFLIFLGTQLATGAAGRGGNPFGPGNNPFRGGGGGNAGLALAGSCFQLIAGFFIWTCALALLLPTSFPRAALVTLFLHLGLLAIGGVIFGVILGLEVGMGWMR
ncbi:MAG: hypothetical protein ACKODX_01890 [Gemmata sp.]